MLYPQYAQDALDSISAPTGIRLFQNVVYAEALNCVSLASGIDLQVTIAYVNYADGPDQLNSASVATGIELHVTIQYVNYAIPADALNCTSVATGIRLG